MLEIQVQSLGWEDPLEEGMATHSSGRSLWTEESGGLQSMGSERVRHNWMTKRARTNMRQVARPKKCFPVSVFKIHRIFHKPPINNYKPLHLLESLNQNWKGTEIRCLISIPFQGRVFLPLVFFFFPFIFISWRLITLQYCSGFCHTLTWISHGFTCIPHPYPPSHLPLHPIPLSLPSAPGPSTCLMHPAWAGDLFHPR